MGTVTIPEDALRATDHYTCRIQTHEYLREAFVVAVHPAAEVPMVKAES